MYKHIDTCALLSNNVPLSPTSPLLPCRNAVRHQDANDPTTWLTSPALAAAITPAPPQMRRRRRRGESLSKPEAEKRGKRKFLMTLGRARIRTWQSAQVKLQHSTADLFTQSVLFTWGLVYFVHILIFRCNDILIYSECLV